MLIPLAAAVTETCGGKAAALGALLRAGLPVPDGVVVPFTTTAEDLEGALDELGDSPVAVRSSATGEDTAQTSAAGQYESFLGVRGAGEIAKAVHACRASLFSPRAVAYRADRPSADPAMAVIIQRHVDAEVSGVMFTTAASNGATEIEASWGLGPSVVEGRITPDAYRVAGDGTITRSVADKQTRLDRRGARLITSEVPAPARAQPTLDDPTAAQLAALGGQAAAVLGGPQDIEWALSDGHLWLLQARPITAALPSRPSDAVPAAALTGTPGSHGTATGTARIVRGPGDFTRVRPGDILICPFTDPAWTPLLRIVAGVVTETGGVLSHAAIVAREQAIPAVLGVPNATNRLHDGAIITLDGAMGTVTRW
ncbi:PEP/pyruvate-binding domain-containing protein [Actinomadura hibisca]|uniref:PEP/pyruvate-binding domain-containing protein n=1 Tax=Actinomadura hibisca TaxID=68565 RepID=UPI000833B2EB|nr:PEP/pyruvate-binding domain-containing protein [Actinomadura hibisca]